MLSRKSEIIVATVFLILGLAVIVLWVPNDSETPMINSFRRQTNIGDAFVPMVAGILIVIFAIVHLLVSIRRIDMHDTEGPLFGGAVLAFLVQLVCIIGISLAIMFWAGHFAVLAFAQPDGAEEVGYRQMRGTYPYKVIGFVLGGTFLVFATTGLIEGKIKLSRLATSLAIVGLLLLVFDVPLDNVLLPPNGDW